MPVGTCGAIKGLTVEQVLSIGTQIVLANTYHLSLRPGAEIVRELGGLHSFMGWPRPILTDSGGYQLVSLARLTRVDEHSATFQSHIDGSTIELTPERTVEIQQQLGSDIAMVLDHVVALPTSRVVVEEAMERTVRWARRCRDCHHSSQQAQFAIIQGGMDEQLRRQCAQELIAMDFPGYAIGGLSVGESPAEMYRVLDFTLPELPPDRPRYLMGVGRPIDLLEGIRRGVDMFDCVMPTRNGRNATAFTDDGPLKLRNQRYRCDARPIVAESGPGFSPLSRAYIRHLFMAGEMLGPILLSLHNLAYYQRLMREAREAIAGDAFLEFYRQRKSGWESAQRLSAI
jgi:queuine tRNA-ribosyltransferase